jgi:hypothetical protein
VPIPAGPDPIPGGIDYVTPHLDVHPYDGTTSTTLEVRPPAPAVAFSPGPCTPTLVSVEIAGIPTTVQRWTAPPVPTPGPYGWWVLAWTVTGTGSQAPEESVYVPPPPLPGGPVWTPTRSRVASYVPSRPLVPIADGRNIDLMTFDETTRPTGGQVDQLIVDAVNWVTDETGALDGTLYESATACAAIRAAAFVELGYPERNDPMKSTANTTSDRLFKQAEQMLGRLAARNEAITGTDPAVPAPLMPLYSFPDPPAWGDQLIS